MNKISEIKEKMKSYKDYHGGNLIDYSSIDKAKTKKELAEILDRHHVFLKDMCTDAQGNLQRFRKLIGLNNI